jgi:hypothetical protein
VAQSYCLHLAQIDVARHVVLAQILDEALGVEMSPARNASQVLRIWRAFSFGAKRWRTRPARSSGSRRR